MRQGLVEWAVVTAVLVLGAAGAAATWGDEIRGAFGVGLGRGSPRAARAARADAPAPDRPPPAGTPAAPSP